jgi:hypothetical protein
MPFNLVFILCITYKYYNLKIDAILQLSLYNCLAFSIYLHEHLATFKCTNITKDLLLIYTAFSRSKKGPIVNEKTQIFLADLFRSGFYYAAMIDLPYPPLPPTFPTLTPRKLITCDLCDR